MVVFCQCGARLNVSESQVGKAGRCRHCRGIVRLVAGALPYVGTGQHDFDDCLVIESGPEHAGEQLLLGGAGPIDIGKREDRAIQLPGAKVSRNHCRLIRQADGVGWSLEDQGSTNGTIVNTQRIKMRHLEPGDVICIGEFQLRYLCDRRRGADSGPAGAGDQSAEEPPGEPPVDDVYAMAEAPAIEDRPAAQSVEVAVASAAAARLGPAPVCPSCQRMLTPGARICVACGIDVKTGRPLVTAQGIDENDLQMRAETTLRVISWLIPLGPFYPIASEAYGTRKPYVVWSLALVTLIASILFWVAAFTSEGNGTQGRGLMLWPRAEPSVEMILAMYEGDDEFMDKAKEISGKSKLKDRELVTATYRALPEEEKAFCPFRWYQLITHAFLHGGILHIAGNLLFLLVFGSRVNALIGNIQTAIVYPLLAVAAGAAHLYFDDGLGPMLGASGAIMGLAGMYVVFFPAHKVHMVSWIRFGLLAGFKLYFKVFAVRGFWVVLFYIAFDVGATLLQARDGVAHWAHLGGFGVGIVFALVLLLSRLVNARGGDVLSMVLGRYAWAMLGKPSGRADAVG